MTGAVAIRGGPPAVAAQTLPPPDLAAFDLIPARHGVAVMAGRVVVYDEEDLHRNGLQDGGFYVVEYQRPRAGLSWEGFLRLEAQCQGSPRGRLDTQREVVRILPWPTMADHWQLRFCRSQWVDGPISDRNLADMIVGKVVGLYAPPALAGTP